MTDLRYPTRLVSQIVLSILLLNGSMLFFFIYMYDHHFRPRSAQKEKIRI